MRQAMILAAGLGVRLRPLTLARPKPLVPILNRPLLGIILECLRKAGVVRLAVNTHYLARQVEAYLEEAAGGDLELAIFYEPRILGTGGGIRNTALFWDQEPFMVINGDLLTDIDLEEVYSYHLDHDSPVTLVLQDHPRYNQVCVNQRGEITGFYKEDMDRTAHQRLLAFTGIHVLDPQVLTYIPPGRSHIIDTYTHLIHRGVAPRAYVAEGHFWKDIGLVKDYLEVHELLLTGAYSLDKGFLPVTRPFHLGEDLRREPGVRLEGWASLGRGVTLKRGSQVVNSVVWDGVTLEEGAQVKNSVVTDGVRVQGKLEQAVITAGGVTHVQSS